MGTAAARNQGDRRSRSGSAVDVGELALRSIDLAGPSTSAGA